MCEDRCSECEWNECCSKTHEEDSQQLEKVELSSDALTFLRNNLPMLLDMIWDAGEAPTTVADIDDQIQDLKIMREIIAAFKL